MTSRRYVTVSNVSVKWGEMVLGLTSPWAQELIIIVAPEEALQAWQQLWLECAGALTAAML